jgi:drug/metabolite transporter (DMT)-like permease
MAGTSRSAFSPGDVGLFATLSAMWGLSFLFIKVAVGQLGPAWVVSGRTLVGGAVLLVILRVRGRRLPRGLAMWGHLLVLASVGNAIPWGLVAAAQRNIPSGLASVVNSLVPVSTLVVAAAVGQERLSSRRIAGLLLAVAGVAAVMAGELEATDRLLSVGVVAFATLLYGASAVYAKRFVSGRVPPLAVATGQVLVAALLATGWAAATDRAGLPPLGELRPEVVASTAALGALGTGLAFLVFYVLIERVGATNATMVTYVMPVLGVLAGWLVLDERLGWNVAVGAAAILAGVWLAQREAAHDDPVAELQELGA